MSIKLVMSTHRRVTAYVIAIVMLAGASVVAAGLTDLGEITSASAVAALAGLIAFEGILAANVARGGGNSETQGHEEAVFVFTLLAFSPLAALVAVAAGAVVANVVSRREPLKAVFNVANYVGSAALGVIAAAALGARDDLDVRGVAAVLIGALLFAVLTRAAVSGVLTLATGVSFYRDFVDELRPAALRLTGSVSVGLLAGVAAASNGWLLPFVFASMFAVAFAFSGHDRARRQRQLLEDLLRYSHDGIFSTDAAGRIRLWNRAMAEMTGHEMRDAVGARADTLIRAVASEEASCAIFAPGAEPTNATAVLRLSRADQDVSLRVSRAALPEGGYSFIARDITAEHDALLSLQANEERLRSALEAGAMGWWEADMDTNVEVWSANLAAMFGVSPADAPCDYEEYLAYVHAADRDAVLKAVARARDTGVFSATYRIVRADGATRWLEGSGKVISTERGRKMIGISKDVTERVQMEANLLHAQKVEAVAALAAGIAHDFNNMLSAVNGYSELTLALLADDDPARANVEQIAAAGARAAEISRQLLTFSRKDSTAPSAVNLESVLAGIERLIAKVVPAHVEIVTSVEPNVGMIRADPGQLEQVLVNLAVNAGHAMPDGGILRISLGNTDLVEDPCDHRAVPTAPYVRVAVTDTGIGMDHATQARIFEPFFTTKATGEGTGLGLSSVASIVERSGGVVTVTSSPGAGTTFELLFPRLDVITAHPQETLLGSTANRVAAEPAPTILLVEDSAGVRAFERLVLEEDGCLVLEAANAGEALRIASQFDARIDVLVTDVMMPPGQSGPELAEELLLTRPEMKIAYASGYTRQEVAWCGVRPSDPFMSKPVTADALISVVSDLCRPSSRRREGHGVAAR